MNCFLVGGAGFIGTSYIEALDRNSKYDSIFVIDSNIDSLSRLSELKRAGHLTDRVKGYAFDVARTDWIEFFQSIIKGPVDIYHLAANSDIAVGQADPDVDRINTFLTTYNCALFSKRVDVRNFVFASSSAIYGDCGAVAITEDYGPLMPISNYGAMKLASEACLFAFKNSFERLRIIRFPNVVGPHLTHGVIYDFIQRLEKDPRELKVLGDGTQLKPYLYVHDLIAAIELTLSHPDASSVPVDIFNVSGADSTTVKFIAEAVANKFNCTTISYQDQRSGWVGDVPEFLYDTSKIKALGWRPNFSSNDAVLNAIDENIS